MWERLSSPLSDVAASRKKERKKKALIKKKKKSFNNNSMRRMFSPFPAICPSFICESHILSPMPTESRLRMPNTEE